MICAISQELSTRITQMSLPYPHDGSHQEEGTDDGRAGADHHYLRSAKTYGSRT